MEIELKPLEVDPQAYKFFPNDKEQKSQFTKKGNRFFFYGQIQHDEYQKRKLKQFHQYLQEKKQTYDKQRFKEQQVLLFLQANQYKPKETLTNMKTHVEFVKEYLPVSFQKVQDLIKKGFLYPCGRDKQFRPILVCNAKLVDVNDPENALLATIYVQQEIIKTMFIPGQVQNWVIIYNLDNMGVTEIPMNSLKSISAKLSQNYGGRLHKIFTLNAPGTIWFTWKVVSSFLDAITVEKITICKSHTDKQLFKNIDSSQVEAKFGGSQCDRKQFYPFSIPRGVFQEQRLISDAQYENMYKEGKLANNTIDPKYL